MFVSSCESTIYATILGCKSCSCVWVVMKVTLWTQEEGSESASRVVSGTGLKVSGVIIALGVSLSVSSS